MTIQQVDQPCRPAIADDCVSIAEINYLIQTRQIDYIILAGNTMVSLAGLCAYLERHADNDPDEQPLLDVMSRSEDGSPWGLGHREQQSASTVVR